MKTIDLCGIARSGKTTTAENLRQKYPEIVFHPERHDLVPEEIKSDAYKYSIWYAEYCIEEFKEAIKIDKIHIFERGIVDHIVMGNVYHTKGYFDDNQYEEYSKILKPYISKIDLVIIFLIPIMESVSRAKEMGKDVKKAIPYMEELYAGYKQVPTWHSNVEYLPEDASLDELQELTQDIIFLK